MADHMKGIHAKLEAKLGALQLRLIDEAEQIDLEEATATAIADALDKVPGAKSAAADMVSTAMFRGLGATFDEYAGDVDEADGDEGGAGWDYTAVMDGATCEECESQDGDHYATWEEIAGAGGPLPDGGPNPDCYGSDRCRCRPTPA